MNQPYVALKPVPLPAATVVKQPAREAPRRLALDDAAAAAMTDFAQVPAVVVDPDLDLEGLLRTMIRRNVRLLFVVNDRSELLGLVTAADALRARPPQEAVAASSQRAPRARELMTPQARLEALRLADVAGARVGDVLATLRESGRQHAIVLEEEEGGSPFVRGIFSAAQLEAQLGQPLASTAAAPTFAELEAALGRWKRHRALEEAVPAPERAEAQAARDRDFPNAPADWTREDALEAARREGIELGEDHWRVIRALQAYFARHEGVTIRMRELHDALEEAFHARGGLRYLYTIFPGGPIAQGCRLAGLRAPAGATDQSYGSVA
jgi:tRNA 2-thiouridine synthesizing protein E